MTLTFSKFLAIFLLFGVTLAFAHQPQQEEGGEFILDPTVASVAIYGTIATPGEEDVYMFTASKDAKIPVEVLVPVRKRNEFFRPQVRIEPGDIEVPAPIGEREIFFEPFSVEKLYRGVEEMISVEAGTTYTISIFDPLNQTGDYSLGVGTVEDFSNVNFFSLIARVVGIKLGLSGSEAKPILDIFGLLLFIAGFIVGLGAVTVMDIHGFLARKSKYWTESTIRAHKVTKPLIWIGLFLAICGAGITYRESGLSGVALFQLILLFMLIANGIYLSFRVSPFLIKREKEGRSNELLPKSFQRKIIASFIISFIGWWGALFLLVWHIVLLS